MNEEEWMSEPPGELAAFNAPQRPLSVAQLTFVVKDLLETALPTVWVCGEISNFSRPQSGHCYFTLKDDKAQIRAVAWRGTATQWKFNPQDGLEVLACGALEVYAPRGTYQLVVRTMEPRGVGALELALRQLKAKLEAEGLFDPGLKRPLPAFPRRVAFVTSPTGAAVRDFLEILRRRFPGTSVLVAPVRVQGDQAAGEIAQAVDRLNRWAEALELDVIVVGRGGGSLEDLWPFNEEAVVRAVHRSKVPVVSAVGHEIDVTLCDLAADVRAATPSEAAELVTPSKEDVALRIKQLGRRALAAMRAKAMAARRGLEQVEQRRAFRRPFDQVHELTLRLDDLEQRIARSGRRVCDQARQSVAQAAGRLEALSPLSVLARGYSVTRQVEEATNLPGKVVRDSSELAIGQAIVTLLGTGSIVSRVEQKDPFPWPPSPPTLPDSAAEG